VGSLGSLQDRQFCSFLLDRLGAVARRVVAVSNPSDTPGCSTLSNQLRSVIDETEIVLDGTFQSLFSYTGSGKFVGCVLSFDGKEPEVRVVIDGTETIFSLTLQEITDAEFSVSLINSGGGGPMVSANQMLYVPPCPVAFTTSVAIEATDSGGKKLLASYVTITEET